MKRLVILAISLMVGMLGTEANAGGDVVTVGNNVFDPDDVLLMEPGASVTWDWVGGGGLGHNVQQDDQIFRSGDLTPSGSATYQRIFSAGTFHYYCENHGSATGGMDGVVRVRPRVVGAPEGPPFTVRWATPTTNTGEAFDVWFRVNDGRWRVWRTDTTRVATRFGVNDMPIRVRPGRTYSFRARSQLDAASPAAVSGWSSVASITV